MARVEKVLQLREKKKNKVLHLGLDCFDSPNVRRKFLLFGCNLRYAQMKSF